MRTRFGILALLALGTPAALLVGCDGKQAASSDPSRVDPVSNLIVITSGNKVLWNGQRVTLGQLRENLEQSGTLPVEPELQFVPEPQASYDLSVQVLNVIRDSGVTNFGFVGNEKYRAYPDEGERP